MYVEEDDKDTKKETKSFGLADIDQLPDDDDDEKQDIDYEANAYDLSAPPKPGKYRWAVTLGERGMEEKVTDRGPKQTFYSIPLVFELVSDDPLLMGAKFYQNCSTLVSARKKTSTLITVLQLNKVPMPNGRLGRKEQLVLLASWLKTEPKVWVGVDWEVRFKDTDDKGKETWRTKYKTYRSIPTDKNGEKLFRFMQKLSNKDEIEIGASLRPDRWYGPHANTEEKPATQASGAPAKKSAPVDMTVEDLESSLA